MKRLKTLLFGAVIFALALAPPVAAEDAPQSKMALSVSPAILEYIVDPGQTVGFQVTVTNMTNFPLPIKGDVRDFSVLSDDLEKTDKDRLDASAWFNLEEPDFILQPNQPHTVKGTLSPPANAVPGGHYATLYFQPLIPHEVLSPATAYLNSKIGVLAMMIVKGDIQQKAEFAGDLRIPKVLRHGPAEFKFAIHNTGTVHLMPSGKLVIYDSGGRELDHIDVPPGMILPNATKEFTMSWPVPHNGRYHAELQVTYGSDQVPLPKLKKSFLVTPWIETISGILLMIGLSVFLYKTRRRWRKVWHALRAEDN